jgi:hypothetical protein
MLADRAGAVVGSVEAVVADDVCARIEHVGRAYAPAEETRLLLGLEKVHEYLPPPEGERIARNVVRETAEQRLVLAVAPDVRN